MLITRISSWLDSCKTRNRNVGVELSILVVLLSAFSIEMAHVATTLWRRIFLYDGDSVTLSLIYRSLLQHEPIKWVFSAQMNLFPEGPLYAISALIGHSVATTLLINAALNCLVLYGLIRLFLRVATNFSLLHRQIWGLLTMLTLFALMMLEVPTAQAQTLLTYVLFTTYYDGPLFVGIALMCFVANQLRQLPPAITLRSVLLIVGVVGLEVLTIASNPLYVVQFTIPLLAVLFGLGMFKVIHWRRVTALVVPHLASVIMGLGLRVPLRGFLGQSTGSHLASLASLTDWQTSLPFAIKAINPLAATTGLHVRVVLIILIYFGGLLSFLLQLNKSQKGPLKPIRPELLFVATFIALEPIILIACLYSGQAVPERYLIVPTVLTLLFLPLYADPKQLLGRLQQKAAPIITVLSLFILIGGILALPHLTTLIHGKNIDEQCLAEALHFKPANGLSGYWVARTLDVYNVHDERILQALTGPSVYPWLNNVASYDGKKFSFYVIQRHLAFTPLFHPLDSLQPAGYTSVSTCQNFYVYHYAPGSIGYNQLNAGMAKSLHEVEAARKAGKIPELSAKNGQAGKY